MLYVGDRAGNVRQYEELRVAHTLGNQVDSLFCELHGVQLLIDYKIQLVRDFRHALVVLLHVEILGLHAEVLYSLFALILDEGLVLR